MKVGLLIRKSFGRDGKTLRKFLVRAQLSAIVCLVCCLCPAARAERLPLRNHTAADGLASSAINHIFRDSIGFLWFSTRDGLSRFDGSEFSNYRLGDNQTAQTVSFFLESRSGTYWISAEALYRLKRKETSAAEPDNTGKPGDNRLSLNAEKVFDKNFRVLFEDSSGRLWGGAQEGLFLIDETTDGTVSVRQIDLGARAQLSARGAFVRTITEASDGSLWIGCETGIVRRLPDGRMLLYPLPRRAKTDETVGARETADGRIFVGHSTGLFIFQPELLADLADAENFSSRPMRLSEKTIEASGAIDFPARTGKLLKLNFSLPEQQNQAQNQTSVNEVFKSGDGKLWIQASGALFVTDGANLQILRDENGLPHLTANIAEDIGGNLWLGTSSGAIKFARRGLTTFNRRDGLIEPRIHSIHQNERGEIFIVHGDWRISRPAAGGFESVRLNMPPDAKSIYSSTVAFPDDSGAWWALTANGLYRFERLDESLAPQVFGQNHGLKGESLYTGFEDSRGDLWFSNRLNTETDGVSRFEKETRTFRAFSAAEGYPEGKAPTSFAEDARGSVWFGFYGGGMARFERSTNRFRELAVDDGVPRGGIFDLHVDKKGRLWVASNREGLSRIDDTSAEKLKFIRYTTVEGLASNNIWCVTEDTRGDIYAGSVRGLDRISPDTGKIRHYSTADGLAADFVNVAFGADDGTLWFGTPNGLSRLKPEADTPVPAPQIFISNLNIAGVRYALSEFGQREIGALEVGANENNLQIDFLGVGDNLRYQYRLEGADADWSAPTESRTVNFSSLAAGNYKFLVRAMNPDGATSENPAVVTFKIRPPFWRTWQFIAMIIALVGLAVFALDRYRVGKTREVQNALAEVRRSKAERLRELKQVRTRIATDLHDDIGSSLSQIAVLSEVARAQTGNNGDNINAAPLEQISTVSNELVEAMSDIVWAINPTKDNLLDLTQRMRRFASDVFTAKKIEFEFAAPDVENELPIGANLRREVFVIFKESINNIVRHSGANKAKIEFEIGEKSLKLSIADDGRGFDVAGLSSADFVPSTRGGNGVLNIKRRAAELGGACEIFSENGKGTRIILEIPLQLPISEKENIPLTQTGSETANGKSLNS